MGSDGNVLFDAVDSLIFGRSNKSASTKVHHLYILREFLEGVETQNAFLKWGAHQTSCT